jgi:hypothetical protein
LDVRSCAIAHRFYRRAVRRLSATAGNPNRAGCEKGGELRKRALRPPAAGGMIAAMNVNATISGEVMRASEADGPAMEMAEAIGLSRRRASKRRKGRPSCVDCFFHCQMLCALDLDEPCSTFRPNSEDGLVPPRQPALLVRQAADESPARAA